MTTRAKHMELLVQVAYRELRYRQRYDPTYPRERLWAYLKRAYGATGREAWSADSIAREALAEAELLHSRYGLKVPEVYSE